MVPNYFRFVKKATVETDKPTWIGYRDTSRSDRNWYENVTMNDSSDNSQIFSINPTYKSNLYSTVALRVPEGTVSKTYYLSASVDRYNGNMDLYYHSGAFSDFYGKSETDALAAGALRIWHNPAPGDNVHYANLIIDSNGAVTSSVV